MKTQILILLTVATNLFSVHANAQVNQTNNGQTTDPTFGVLELFDGTPLHLNRVYSDMDKLAIRAHVPLEGHYEWHTPLLIKKSKDGNSLIIQKGNMYTIELHKTNIPGTFKVPARFGNKDSRKRDISAKILADGSFHFSYTEKFPSRNVYNDEFYEISGLGLKLTSYRMDPHLLSKESRAFNYYETKQEHEKTSRLHAGQKDLRIISLGESTLADNSSFRFLAGMQTNIHITSVSTGKNVKAYVTLYGIDGELIKEVEVKGALSLSYVIPEDGFYYISTMVEEGGELKITLEEKG